MWVKVKEKIEDSQVSRELANAGVQRAAPAQWRLMNARSWPARVYPHFEFANVGVSLKQVEQLLNNPSINKGERQQISVNFLNHLSKADFQGLQDVVARELERLNAAEQ